MKNILFSMLFCLVAMVGKAVSPTNDTLLLKLTHKSGFQECILLTDKVSCLLRNGQNIKGQLIGITDSLLTIVGKAGEMRIKPSDIVRMNRLAFDSNYHRTSHEQGIAQGMVLTTVFGLASVGIASDDTIRDNLKKPLLLLSGLMIGLGIFIFVSSLSSRRKRSSSFHLERHWHMEIVPQTPEDLKTTKKHRKRRKIWAWIDILSLFLR